MTIPSPPRLARCIAAASLLALAMFAVAVPQASGEVDHTFVASAESVELTAEGSLELEIGFIPAIVECPEVTMTGVQEEEEADAITLRPELGCELGELVLENQGCDFVLDSDTAKGWAVADLACEEGKAITLSSPFCTVDITDEEGERNQDLRAVGFEHAEVKSLEAVAIDANLLEVEYNATGPLCGVYGIEKGQHADARIAFDVTVAAYEETPHDEEHQAELVFKASDSDEHSFVVPEKEVAVTGEDIEGGASLVFGETTLECSSAAFAGVTSSEEQGELAITPEYGGTCTLGEVEAEVVNDGCDYVLGGGTSTNAHAKRQDATLKIDCNETGSLTVKAAFCTIDIPDKSEGEAVNQSLHGVAYESMPSVPHDYLVADVSLATVVYRATNSGCGIYGVSKGVHSDGSYADGITLRSYTLGKAHNAENQLDLWLESF